MEYRFLRLSPEDIDTTEGTFRVRLLQPPSLQDSIRRRGIRTPLLVQRAGPRHRLISGWRRWKARPEGESLPCFLLPEEMADEEVWDTFLRDNDTWNVVEVARVLQGLALVPGLTPERIVVEKLALLGIHASRDLYRRYVRLLGLPPEAQQFIEEENLPLRRTATFFRLPPEALGPLLACARDLHFTLNELGEVLEMLQEVSQRDGVSAGRVIEELRSGPAGREKGTLRRVLRERRYPELGRYHRRLEAIQREVRFTVPVRLEWDERLERPGIRLVASLVDEEELERFDRELREQHATLGRFFEVL